jgi:hypothetical protein
MLTCPRCGKQFTGRAGKIYCTDYCRKKVEKARWRARGAAARSARHAAWLAEQVPKWEALRAAKAAIKEAKRAARPPPEAKRERKRRLTISERLEALSVCDPETGCRVWSGRLSRKGYAMIWVGGKHRIGPRVAYEAWVGPIPEGMMVCHHCDNPACIEPGHLYAGTARTNYDDMVARGRRQAPYSKKDRPPKKPKPFVWKRYMAMNI